MTSQGRIRIVGAGYVGLVTAAGLVRAGHRVELVETRADRRSALQAGRSPIFEQGLEEILTPAVAGGEIVVTEAPTSAAVELVLVCVGTPIDDQGASDLTQLIGALEDARRALADGAAVVVRSTTPIGSTRRLIAALGLPERQLFLNPEFLRQGTALADFGSPTRVVIGNGADPDDHLLERIEAVLAATQAPVLRVTYEEAELIKNAANAFLALKLSFTNELALLSRPSAATSSMWWPGWDSTPKSVPPFSAPRSGSGGAAFQGATDAGGSGLGARAQHARDRRSRRSQREHAGALREASRGRTGRPPRQDDRDARSGLQGGDR